MNWPSGSRTKTSISPTSKTASSTRPLAKLPAAAVSSATPAASWKAILGIGLTHVHGSSGTEGLILSNRSAACRASRRQRSSSATSSFTSLPSAPARATPAPSSTRLPFKNDSFGRLLLHRSHGLPWWLHFGGGVSRKSNCRRSRKSRKPRTASIYKSDEETDVASWQNLKSKNFTKPSSTNRCRKWSVATTLHTYFSDKSDQLGRMKNPHAPDQPPCRRSINPDNRRRASLLGGGGPVGRRG